MESVYKIVEISPPRRDRVERPVLETNPTEYLYLFDDDIEFRKRDITPKLFQTA